MSFVRGKERPRSENAPFMNALGVVGARAYSPTRPCPVRMKEFPTWTVHTLIGMGPKKVALRLQ
jgi:hypothetical protein